MRYLIILTFISFSTIAFSSTVTGYIFDNVTKEPLAFTNIAVEGKSLGSISNIDGEFVLEIESLSPDDIIVFSHVGYEPLKITVAELQNENKIYLKAVSVNLQTVEVSNKELKASDIVALVEENFEKNYPQIALKQKVFYHNYELVPWPDKNKFEVKRSNFVGLDKETLQEVFDMMPDEFIEYYDALVKLYSKGGDYKVQPIEGISMEEGSQEELYKEMEKKMTAFFKDVESSLEDEDVYYKFRTGIIGSKIDMQVNSDSLEKDEEKDTSHYSITTNTIKHQIESLLDKYSDLESKNWEFITSRGKYRYKTERVTVYNEELVYEISFKPKGRGLFEGVIYVSVDTYALLQMDFAFAEGKQNENFQLLGIGHAMKYKQGRVIFDKVDSAYYIKYINAKQYEIASVDRNFLIMKKRKRFLIDKTLNEMKMGVELFFDINSDWELLVIEREFIDNTTYDEVEQPEKMKFKMKYAYSPEMWESGTVLTPNNELKKYKRSK